jgi:hypothetical protein
MRRAVPTALAAICCLLFAASAGAAQLQRVQDGFDSPVHVTSEPGNPERLYVVEQDGTIYLVTPNAKTVFVDLEPQVRSPGEGGAHNEEGLMSVAFDPEFASTGLLYVFYTDNSSNLQVSELRASGDTASPSTLRPVLNVLHPDNGNHNGGQLAFGRDGYLYISTGDGAGNGTPAQDLASLLGKILRIDPRGAGAGVYSVPPDNPFAGPGPERDEVWSYGLRNPFRFSFDRVTGDMVIGDVGASTQEEIDFSPAPVAGKGVNWGWPCREGDVDGPVDCSAPGAVEPVHTYGRGAGICAVTGGFVVRDPGLTELLGRYIYADYCVGEVRSNVLGIPSVSDDRLLLDANGMTTSFGEDACGRTYVVTRDGVVSRIVDGTPTDCSAVTPPPPPAPEGECGEIIRGSNGDDELRGGPGSQQLIGRGGKDDLRGRGGDDCIDGGRGKDVIRGGGGRDEIDGGAGKDVIRSRDGKRDVVDCGPGRDTVKADEKDKLRRC